MKHFLKLTAGGISRFDTSTPNTILIWWSILNMVITKLVRKGKSKIKKVEIFSTTNKKIKYKANFLSDS